MHVTVDRVEHDSGRPAGVLYAPSAVVIIIACGLAVCVLIDWPVSTSEFQAGAIATAKVALGGLSAILFAHQLAAGIFSHRFARLYSQRLVPRNGDDGIGPPNPEVKANRPYIRQLINEAYTSYNSYDLTQVIDLLLEPQRFTQRITEEVRPEEPIAWHMVTKDIVFDKNTNSIPAVPIGDFPKGMLLDEFTVQANGRPVNLMSYEEGLRFTTALIFTARLAEYVEQFPPGSGGSDAFLDDQDKARQFRDQLARDVYEVLRPAKSLKEEFRRQSRAESVRTEEGFVLSRADALVAKLRVDYIHYAYIDESTSTLRISYSRATSIHGTTQSSSLRQRDWSHEIRFRLGQFPFRMAIMTPLIYKCQSYHLRAALPSGLFVHSHEIYERNNDGTLTRRRQHDFSRASQVVAWEDKDVPPADLHESSRSSRTSLRALLC
jgi:hypothetical protein